MRPFAFVDRGRCLFLLHQRLLIYSSFGHRFSSLFVEALPTEYFQRVWDIFLSEGACGSRVFLCSQTQLTCSRRYSRYGVSHPYRASDCDVLSPYAAWGTPRVRGIDRPDAPAAVLDLVFARDPDRTSQLVQDQR